MGANRKVFGMKRIIALVVYLWANAAIADVVDFPLTIGGITYQAELTKNTALANRVSAQLGVDVGDHYFGTIASVPESWLRLSKVNAQWQGVASVYGALYVIAQPVAVTQFTAQAASVAAPAQALADFSDEMGGCGVAGHEAEGEASIAMAMESFVAEEVAFSTFCANNVNGICILPEIEFAFDLAFQSLFGASAGAQAMAIINTAEGFYSRDRMEMDGNNGMNMLFDAITVQFLTSDLFSVTTNASSFLSDIRAKKANGQVPFIKNARALLHVVTGRDFDGGTVGIAFVNAMCNSNGFGSGTTSVVGSGVSQIPLTAIVLAHELGHNLGANHDSVAPNTACPANTHIMSPAVNSSLSGFSDCSVAEMVSVVESVATPDLCFSYPADIVISSPVIPANVNVGDSFSASYMASVADDGFQPVNRIRLEGTSTVGAQFISVTANGNACALDSYLGFGNRSYNCTVDNPPPGGVSVTMNAEVTGFEAQVTMINQAIVATANVVDIVSGNDSATNTMMVSGTITAPPPPADTNASSDSGSGGGGGSLGWPVLLGLMGLFLRRQYC